MNKYYDFEEALRYIINNSLKITENSEYKLFLAIERSDKYNYFYIIKTNSEDTEEYTIHTQLICEKITLPSNDVTNLHQLRQEFEEIIGFDFYTEYVIGCKDEALISFVVENVRVLGYNGALIELLLSEDNVYKINDEIYLTSEIYIFNI